MGIHVDWSGVRDRVIAVEEAQKRSPHQPIFEPVLTAEEIAEVEAQYGVALPEEYRSFVMQVGAGGPGPALELTSLRRIDGRWGWVWGTAGPEYPWILDPSGPFIETDQWAEHQVAALRAAGHEPTTRDIDEDYLDDYRQAFGELAGEEAFHLQRGRGALHISDNGCGMTSWLIVIGPHRGELRDRDCAPNPPFEPHIDAEGSRHTFYTWYLEWLERREAESNSRSGV